MLIFMSTSWQLFEVIRNEKDRKRHGVQVASMRDKLQIEKNSDHLTKLFSILLSDHDFYESWCYVLR